MSVEVMEEFRRRSRAVWETCFAGARNQSYDVLDAFFQIRRLLFRVMVLDETGPLNELPHYPDSSLGLMPGRLRALGSGDRLRLSINAERGRFDGTWDPEIEVDSESVDAAVLDLFDWDPLHSLEHEFLLVKITESRENPDLVGYYALVRALHCAVVVLSEGVAEGTKLTTGR